MTTAFRNQIRSAKLQQLYDYWDGKRLAPDQLPSRKCLDPLDIPALLPWLILFDVGETPRDTRYRLVGTKVTERIGRDLTGTLIADGFWGAETEQILARYWKVAQTRIPEVNMRSVKDAAQKSHQYEFMMLPLASDGHKVDMLLAGVCFGETDQKLIWQSRTP